MHIPANNEVIAAVDEHLADLKKKMIGMEFVNWSNVGINTLTF